MMLLWLTICLLVSVTSSYPGDVTIDDNGGYTGLLAWVDSNVNFTEGFLPNFKVWNFKYTTAMPFHL